MRKTRPDENGRGTLPGRAGTNRPHHVLLNVPTTVIQRFEAQPARTVWATVTSMIGSRVGARIRLRVGVEGQDDGGVNESVSVGRRGERECGLRAGQRSRYPAREGASGGGSEMVIRKKRQIEDLFQRLLGECNLTRSASGTKLQSEV